MRPWIGNARQSQVEVPEKLGAVKVIGADCDRAWVNLVLLFGVVLI